MDANEIRDMSDAEIEAKIEELGSKLLMERTRREQGYGQGTPESEAGPDYDRHRRLKRDIARLKTIKRERQL